MREFGVNPVVAINRFPGDTIEEIELVRKLAVEQGAYAAEVNDAFEQGGAGAAALAEAVVAAADEPSTFDFVYPLDAPIEEKIEAIAKRVYGADGIFLLKTARDKIAQFNATGLDRLPICMAKTHLSLSHDAVAHERADRLHGDDPRPARLHRRRLDRRTLRRHADDARLRRESRCGERRHRRRGTHCRPFLRSSPTSSTKGGASSLRRSATKRAAAAPRRGRRQLRSAGLRRSQREYKDLDFATTKKGSGDTQTLLRDLGYEPHVGFNAMNARERLLFFDNPNSRQVDVFVGSFRMCHEIPLERRLDRQAHTVPLAELVLTKLQIIELNEKDVRDAVALLRRARRLGGRRGINGARVAEPDRERLGPLAHDHAESRLGRRAPRELRGRSCPRQTRLDDLQKRIEEAPKSRAWRLRDKIGERKRWYELPEEVGGV